MGSKRMTYNCVDCGARTTGWVRSGRPRRCKTCAAAALATHNAEVSQLTAARRAAHPKPRRPRRVQPSIIADNPGGVTIAEAMRNSVLVSP